MVSFHTPLIPNERIAIPEFDNNSSKKRKWDEQPKVEQVFGKRFKLENEKSIFDIELHLETPLPFDWQRCLDIQSGHVYFYNTRTHERTSRDPRRSPDRSSPPPGHMSLDLELNLPYESHDSNDQADDDHDDNFKNHNSSPNSSFINNSNHLFTNSSQHKKNSSSSYSSDGRDGGRLALSPSSWLAFEEGQQQEMVAAVCKRCFMLVMLCKSSPACPNCKFMHPPEQTTPNNLFKKRLSQLLY